MSRRANLARALLVVLVACLGMAPAAGAEWLEPTPRQQGARELIRELAVEETADGHGTLPFHSRFDLKAKGGYRVAVVSQGESVVVAVQRGAGFATTGYVVRGTATRGRIQASFGKLGMVSMRFRPSANRTWVHPHRSCRGSHRFLARSGVYVGRFRFRGEDGYVSVDVKRAKGSVREVAPECVGRGSRSPFAEGATQSAAEGRDRPEHAFLTASWREGITATEFLVLEGRDGRNDYLFETETAQGRMAIVRAAILFGAHGQFTHDDALTTARVAPPPPFHGAGTYRVAPDGTKTWQGKLSVSMPGDADIPLTGSPFEVEFGLLATGLFF
jgi:hypothetical protein